MKLSRKLFRTAVREGGNPVTLMPKTLDPCLRRDDASKLRATLPFVHSVTTVFVFKL